MIKKDEETKDRTEPTVLLGLLRCIPMNEFVRMVARSGLTCVQARKLCDEFKRLKK